MPTPVTRVQKLTLALIGVVLVLVLVFHLPISFISIAAGAVLAFTDLSKQNEAIAGISWSTVLLVAGMITYISVLQEIGTIDHLAEMSMTIGAPLLVAAVLCYVIGVTSRSPPPPPYSPPSSRWPFPPCCTPERYRSSVSLPHWRFRPPSSTSHRSPRTVRWYWPTPRGLPDRGSTASCCSTPASSSPWPPRLCAGSSW